MSQASSGQLHHKHHTCIYGSGVWKNRSESVGTQEQTVAGVRDQSAPYDI